MSTWRNIMRRREHRERAQPRKRRKFGLLEKHADYVKRARNYQGKQKRIKALKEKAFFRNPDEFYTNMTHAKTKNGIHVRERNDANIDGDVRKLIKTQDLNYAHMIQAQERKKIEKLQSQNHFISQSEGTTARMNSHIIFDSDDDDEDNTLESEEIKEDNGDRKIKDNKGLSDPGRRVQRSIAKAYSELEQRRERLSKLEQLRVHLQAHKNLMGKGRRSKVADKSGGKPAVFVWKKDRKK